MGALSTNVGCGPTNGPDRRRRKARPDSSQRLRAIRRPVRDRLGRVTVVTIVATDVRGDAVIEFDLDGTIRKARDAFELRAATVPHRGEGVELRWDDVVSPEESPEGIGFVKIVDEGRAEGRRTKTGRSRYVPMIPRAKTVLCRLYETTRRTDPDDGDVLKGATGVSCDPAYALP